MVNFKTEVLKFIKKIPKGKVVSYGQVAAACGHPRAARQVGGILRGLDITENWWRVLNNQGIISIKGNWTANKELQKSLLEKEGVKIDGQYKLDMVKYRWKN